MAETPREQIIADVEYVKFRYKESPHYRHHPVTGVLGAVNPQGELVAHVFLEYSELPSEQIADVTQTGELKTRQTDEGERVMVREVHCSLVMPLHVAKSFAAWLENKVSQFEDLASNAQQS